MNTVENLCLSLKSLENTMTGYLTM